MVYVKKEGRKEKELAMGLKHMCVQSLNCMACVSGSPLADHKVRIDNGVIGSPMADQVVRDELTRISLGRQWLTK